MLVEDYAREIRTIGECYLLVSGVTQRIVAVAGVRAGPDGLVVDGVPLPEGASLYRLWRPHQRYRNLPQPKPTASDAVLERWFVADLLAVGVEP